VAVWLLALPPSAAISECVIEALENVFTTRQNRLADGRVNSQTSVFFKSAQLRRGDVMSAYRRPDAEHEFLAVM